MDIQKFIDRTGMSSSKIAESLGINPSSISAWKSGKAVPSYQTCLQLIELGIRMDELFNDDAYNKIKETHGDELRGEVVLSPEECAEIVSNGLALLRANGKDILVQSRQHLSDH